MKNYNVVSDFDALIEVMTNDELNEFQYVVNNGDWVVVLKYVTLLIKKSILQGRFVVGVMMPYCTKN